MKKGFTLIELLAVIVILAIIALIATPIVLNIINNTKDSSILRSAEFYVDALEYSITNQMLKETLLEEGTYKIEEGDICIDSECTKKIGVDVKGKKPESGEITIKGGKINKALLNISNKEIIMNSNREFTFKLAPGLYDKNNKLLASWAELDDKYNITFVIESQHSPGFPIELYEILENYNNPSKLVVDESVKYIGGAAFGGCGSLTSIILPNSVGYIDNAAFSGCKNLTSITLPENASMEEGVFWGCTSLTTVILPNGVDYIASTSFKGCTSLKTITLPDSVTSINPIAFEECTNLKSIYYKGTAEGAPWGAPNATVITNF